MILVTQNIENINTYLRNNTVMTFLYEKSEEPDFWKNTRLGMRDYYGGEDDELVKNRDEFYVAHNPEIITEENDLPYERYKEDVNPAHPDVKDMKKLELFKLCGRPGWIATFRAEGGVRESVKEQIENYGYKRYPKNLHKLDQGDYVCMTMYKIIR